VDTNIFVAGVIGALAPEVVRLYTLRKSAVEFQPWYFLISAIYAVLGGYVATIAPGVTAPWWAFGVGAGLPTVLNTAIRAAGLVLGKAEPQLRSADKEATPARRGAQQPAGAGSGFWHFVRAL